MHQRKMHLITFMLLRITIISIKVLNVIMAIPFSNLETLYKEPYGLLKHLLSQGFKVGQGESLKAFWLPKG